MASLAVESASLLSIPCELRNTIYAYIFEPNSSDAIRSIPAKPDELAVALRLQDPARYAAAYRSTHRACQQLRVLQTCRQIYNEAHLLALSSTPCKNMPSPCLRLAHKLSRERAAPAHLLRAPMDISADTLTPVLVDGDFAYPDVFDLRSRPLAPTKIAAIRHITISARTSKLRALNEAWCGLPFGHPSLRLETLTIVPNRAECHIRSMGEIADLSQSHTLAYSLSETMKSLRNVKCLIVRNDGCFNEVVWRLFYRSFVYRLWRWGGAICGIRFESGETQPGGSAVRDNQWFRVYTEDGDERGVECGMEVCRLVGQTGEVPDLNPAGVGP
ncbi:hypothetical protein DOTSEDRAFT_50505 [Dothistroma septosporum NZE10]|uniref:F-box domain-containing protein n=1 Tax=Dothistroma septosporum (strain NZE10 / CBS 128990) TaxID=675120 RepID=N1PUE0_DOTSN|nr:hypothetical protein DOTSEDRAFT_50505 [Dothistroma septosporum NZE10]